MTSTNVVKYTLFPYLLTYLLTCDVILFTVLKDSDRTKYVTIYFLTCVLILFIVFPDSDLTNVVTYLLIYLHTYRVQYVSGQ